jgi:DinB superfamily
MEAKSEALARQFERRVQDALATLARLSDADWAKVTEAEQWSVGVTAHHIAGVLEPISQMVTAVVAGHASPAAFRLDTVDAMNARHAKDYARCTKAETIELLQRGGAVAAGVIRSLSADQLARKGTVLADAPPMTAEELITGGLLAHLDEHFGSIRKTVGHD